jgi:inosose dehydratase
MKYSRNEFLRLTGVASIASVAATTRFTCDTSRKEDRFKLGLASYTFRNFSLDNTIKWAKRLGLSGVALKAMHMPLEASAEDIKQAAEKVRAAGLNLYGAGVIYMKTQQEVEAAFNYAVNAGLEMIVGVPNHELLPFTEEQVKKTNVKVAIHNHGPNDKLYSSPTDVYDKIKDLDKRIGLCIDIGHVVRIGQDPVIMIERYKDRLYDMHMKDVDKAVAEGGPVEIGHGIIDIPKVIKTLRKINYSGNVAFEYEKDGDDPLAGLAESVGYVRGIMRMT